MWFLQGHPTDVNICALIESIPNGYQRTSYRFKIESANERLCIAIAFPVAPHKPNGSLEIIKNDLLSTIDPLNEEILELNVEMVCHRLRSLKSDHSLELVHTQELITWYLDDISVIKCWVEPGKWHQINYQHKIAADSQLFLPTRLPTLISHKKPTVSCRVWIKGGMQVNLPVHVEKLAIDRGVLELEKNLYCLNFKEWDWDTDLRISTNNWESSDDE